MNIHDAPVVIVGAGPTGPTTAILLSQYGIECVVLERWGTVPPRPRAVRLGGDRGDVDVTAVTAEGHGAGVGAGLRDAASLSRKLAGVLAGTLPASVLDTYETERKPPADAVLIRPDGIVQQAGRRVSDLQAVLPHFDIRTPPPSANDGAETDDRSFDAQAC